MLVHNDDGCPTDHVVLGMNPASDDLVTQLNGGGDSVAHNYNGKEFGNPDPNGDGRPLWMSRVASSISNSGTKLSFALDGVDGASNADEAFSMLVDQGRPLVGPNWQGVYGNGTAWEAALTRLSVINGVRRWDDIDFYWQGVKQTDMTPPSWAASD